MEAIKFSELPSGDKQDLGDNDGLPIIANQENRLLSWGQLKKQLKKQTHADKVEISEDNKAKVPTNEAVETRIGVLAGEINERIDDVATVADGAKATATSALSSAGAAHAEAQSANTTANQANETASSAKATAEGALTAAETASTTANTASQTALTAKETAEGAKADASRYYSELSGKCDINAGAVAKLRTDLEAETTARGEAIASVKTEVSSVATRVSDIETKIASGELGGGSGGGAGETPTVDLTPVNNRLGALEAKDTVHETRLDALESAKTSQAGKIGELETAQSNTTTTVAGQADAIAALQQSTNLTDGEGNKVSVVSAINEAKTAAANAQATADTAKTNAEVAKTVAETASSGAQTAQATASEAKTMANEAKALASVADVQYSTIVTTLSEDGQTVTEMTLTARGEGDPDLTIAQLFNKLFANQAAIMTAINTYNKFNADLQSDLGTFMTELKAQLQIVGDNY